jgi:hypothetical protein
MTGNPRKKLNDIFVVRDPLILDGAPFDMSDLILQS